MSFSLPNIIMGLLGLLLGVWIIVNAFYLNHHVLFLGWVEEKWGPGTGTTAYLFIGLVICLISVFVILGYLDLAGAAFGGSDRGLAGSNSKVQGVPSNNGGGVPVLPKGSGSGRIVD
jgi:hypothetical protein